MNLQHLKKIRVIVSLFIFIFIFVYFLDLSIPFVDKVSKILLNFQFFPSVLRFISLFFTISGLGFLLIILLSILFGRIYCSTICPLGTLQDIIIYFTKFFKPRRNRKFLYNHNSKRILRYSILAVTLLFWISGSLFLINLLDPYSNFGKISTTFFQPLFFWINNSINAFLESFNIYILRPLDIKLIPLSVALVSGIIFLTIIIMSVWRGRLFCNTICPVGGLLGVVSEKSLFKIDFKEESCTSCMKCEEVCKAQCISSKNKTVDQTRCVSCFNCFAACEKNGLFYQYRFANKNVVVKETTDKPGGERRNFLLTVISAVFAIPLFSKNKLLLAQSNKGPGSIPSGTTHPVTPPGSLSHEHFTKHCIACYLCVSACPTNVIVPSFFDYGLKGFMQPKLDYHKSFCNFDCTRCTEVCPTGAITELSHKEKITTQIGVAKFIPENCVVVVEGTDCAACSEHCPTKAVDVVPYKGLWLPEVTPELCIGCGACEYACPTEPNKAIFVESNLKHKIATPVEAGEGPRDHDQEEFPF